MDEELKKAVKKSQATMQESYPKERAKFRALLLTNPNYFGNLAESSFTPVLPISGNTYYEQLGCIGYQSQQRQLEGVVYINQPSGYGTDICGPGTTEFVRFYLSFDQGATWQDQGLTSFQAYNIPSGTEGGKRLEYAVSLPAKLKGRFCWADPLIKMRGILSWNDPPPPNQPNWTPVWGNVRETIILMEPRRLVFPPELFELAKVKLPHPIADALDAETAVPLKAKSLALPELAQQYKNKGVPVHRFAYKELAHLTSGKVSLSAETLANFLPDIKIDPSIIDLLFPPADGDISYEELKCIGLDPNVPDTLVGIIQLKKSAGY
jgi:hypothetical protein